jgi:hypothetical protein
MLAEEQRVGWAGEQVAGADGADEDPECDLFPEFRQNTPFAAGEAPHWADDNHPNTQIANGAEYDAIRAPRQQVQNSCCIMQRHGLYVFHQQGRNEMNTYIRIDTIILSDGSKVYDLTVIQQGKSVTFNCVGEVAAEKMAYAFSDAIKAFTTDTVSIIEAEATLA